MPRKRRHPKTRRAEISTEMMNHLSDREMDSKAWIFFQSDTDILAAWNVAHDEILTEWIATDPGTRPSAWWKYAAPRQPLGTFEGGYYDGKLPEPRRRLGGTGTPSHEVLAQGPWYKFGLPVCWVSKREEDFYNGRARHVDGHRIGTEYREGHFAGVAIDPDDPPRYESEATYLQRLDLLLPGELDRLTAADFEPETIGAEAEPDEAA